jgi:hypothetical protein
MSALRRYFYSGSKKLGTRGFSSTLARHQSRVTTETVGTSGDSTLGSLKGKSIPIEIIAGKTDPVYTEIGSYPDWTESLKNGSSTINQISKKASTAQLDPLETKRLHKLQNRQKIKEQNLFGNAIWIEVLFLLLLQLRELFL